MNPNGNSMLNEVWQAEINFQVQQTNLEELKSWINSGKLQPFHKVRIKNLSWIEAQKVPAFQTLFESKKINVALQVSQIPSVSLPSPIAPTETKPSASVPSVPFQLYEKKILAKTQTVEAKKEEAETKKTEVKPKPIKNKPVINKLTPPQPKTNFVKKFLGFVGGCVLLFLLAWGGSYLWVYYLSPPIEIDKKNNTELIILDEKLNTDKIGLRLKIATDEQALKSAENNQATQTPPLDLNQELAKLEKLFEAQRKNIIETQQTNLINAQFSNTFSISFAVLIILFLLGRIFITKENKPIESSHSTKSPDLETEVDEIFQTSINLNVKSENSQKIHTSKQPAAPIATPEPTAVISVTNSVAKNPAAKIETLDDFLKTPDYQGLLELEKSSFCLLHRDKSSKFVCEICSNYFCENCPKPAGGVENCCPFCGVGCKPFELKNQTAQAEGEVKDEAVELVDSENKPYISELTLEPNKRTQKVGIFSAFLIASLFSVSIAYFWVYEITPFLEKRAANAAENAGGNEQNKGNNANTSENIVNKTTETAKNVSAQNTAPAVDMKDGRCIDPLTNEPFECNEETKKALYEHTRKTESVNNAQKQVSDKTSTILSLVMPSASPESDAAQTTQNPAEIARRENDKRKFLQIFGASFILIFGFLISTRFFSKA